MIDTLTIRDVCRLTAEAYGIPLHRLLSDDRRVRWCLPRQSAMRLAVGLGATASEVGRAFNRHPSTVDHACKRAETPVEAALRVRLRNSLLVEQEPRTLLERVEELEREVREMRGLLKTD